MISPCLLKEYAEVLDFLDLAFQKPGKHWFAHNLEHIFQSVPSSIERHHVMRENGRIVGVIGVYPLKIRIGKAVLNVGGVGSVSSHPDQRGKGIMSKLVLFALGFMEREGYDVSWLGGNRFRYGNYGWDYGGRDIIFSVAVHDLKRYYPGIKPVKLVQPHERDIPALDAMYSMSNAGAVRDTDVWKLHLNRKNFPFVMIQAKSGEPCAYLCHDMANPETIFEIGGDRMGVVALLLRHFAEKKTHWAKIHYPDLEKDPLDGLLFEVASWFSTDHANDMRVMNVGTTWKKLVPEMLKTSWGQGIGRPGFDKVNTDKDRAVILKRALGYFDSLPVMPRHLKSFDVVRPLKWWMSVVDHV